MVALAAANCARNPPPLLVGALLSVGALPPAANELLESLEA